MRTAPVLFFSSVIGLLGGCSASSTSYVDDYQAALETTAPLAADGAPSVTAFVELYRNLAVPGAADQVAAVYAPEFYFSDTLKVIQTRPVLTHYLSATADRLESIEVEVLSVTRDHIDTYVRWRMHTRFDTGLGTADAVSLGISHLRFDQQGQIILHQDFWDSTEGVFRHLPGLGWLVRWVRDRA